jgi:hypothetical protein
MLAIPVENFEEMLRLAKSNLFKHFPAPPKAAGSFG